MPGDPTVRRAAYALTGLAVLALAALVFTRGSGADVEPEAPGEEPFRDAAAWVVAQEDTSARGGDASAEALALALLTRLREAGHDPVRVYAQVRGEDLLFLVGLPGQRLELDQRGAFVETAWELACAGRPSGGEVVLALRGRATLQGVARGVPGQDPQVEAGIVVPGPLFVYFAPARSESESGR